MKNILLVEDSPTDAAILIAAFEEIGYSGNIKVIKTGPEAIEYLAKLESPQHQYWPRLILLDLNLPIKSGLEVLTIIKTHPVWMYTPTIILSSSSSPSDIDNSYKNYANAYISKPREFEQYEAIASSLYDFWFEVAQPCYI